MKTLDELFCEEEEARMAEANTPEAKAAFTAMMERNRVKSAEELSKAIQEPQRNCDNCLEPHDEPDFCGNCDQCLDCCECDYPTPPHTERE